MKSGGKLPSLGVRRPAKKILKKKLRVGGIKFFMKQFRQHTKERIQSKHNYPTDTPSNRAKLLNIINAALKEAWKELSAQDKAPYEAQAQIENIEIMRHNKRVEERLTLEVDHEHAPGWFVGDTKISRFYRIPEYQFSCHPRKKRKRGDHKPAESQMAVPLKIKSEFEDDDDLTDDEVPHHLDVSTIDLIKRAKMLSDLEFYKLLRAAEVNLSVVRNFLSNV